MKIRFLTLTIFLVCLISCQNAAQQADNQTVTVADVFPDYIVRDPLFSTSEVRVVSTYPSGAVETVHFCAVDTSGVVVEKRYYESGRLKMEGRLVAGLRTGRWISWYESGVIWSTGEFLAGKKHGRGNVYFPNGQKRYSKNFENDLATGLWEFFDEGGAKIGEAMYDKGAILWSKASADKAVEGGR